jgi:hypothetical protein
MPFDRRLCRYAPELDNIIEGEAGWQRAIRAAPTIIEPRGTERIRHRGWSVSDQQHTLQDHSNMFRNSPRMDFLVQGSMETALQPVDCSIEAAIGAAGRIHFGEQHLDGSRLLSQRAEDIETDDIAGTFPNAVERSLPVKPRHDRFFDISGAAKTFQCFTYVAGQAFVYPVFGGSHSNTGEKGSGGA